MSERQYWVGFNIVNGIGPARVRLLRDHFDSLHDAWHAPISELKAAGLKGRPLDNLLAERDKLDLPGEIARLDKAGAAVLTWEDTDYPQRLLQIKMPPPVLYVRGSLDETDDLALAIVGTRQASVYGKQVTFDLASELARNGITIVSGLAIGIDSVAHTAALDAGGRTIAVMASGVDIIYPSRHRTLAERIMQQGAIVSDYPLGREPEARNFPPRNRIISGLSMGVLVTEAGIKSGALITANDASEQGGREVFAVPGNITAKGSNGTNKLIQDGAHTVTTARDILEVMNLTAAVDYVEARESLPSDDTEKALLAQLEDGPLHIDELGRLSGLAIDKVSSKLVLMELKGMVREVDSMTYARV